MINRFWPGSCSFKPCSTADSNEFKSKISLHKLESFSRSGVVGVYILFYWICPLKAPYYHFKTSWQDCNIHSYVSCTGKTLRVQAKALRRYLREEASSCNESAGWNCSRILWVRGQSEALAFTMFRWHVKQGTRLAKHDWRRNTVLQFSPSGEVYCAIKSACWRYKNTIELRNVSDCLIFKISVDVTEASFRG